MGHHRGNYKRREIDAGEHSIDGGDVNGMILVVPLNREHDPELRLWLLRFAHLNRGWKLNDDSRFPQVVFEQHEICGGDQKSKNQMR